MAELRKWRCEVAHEKEESHADANGRDVTETVA